MQQFEVYSLEELEPLAQQFIQKHLEYQRQLKKNLGLGASKNIAPTR